MTIEQMAAALNQRIGQFIENALSTYGDRSNMFYVEDTILRDACRKYYYGNLASYRYKS